MSTSLRRTVAASLVALSLTACSTDPAGSSGSADGSGSGGAEASTGDGATTSTADASAGGDGGGAGSTPAGEGSLVIVRLGVLGVNDLTQGLVAAKFLPGGYPDVVGCTEETFGPCVVGHCDGVGEAAELVTAGTLIVDGASVPISVEPVDDQYYWTFDGEEDPLFQPDTTLAVHADGGVVPPFEFDISTPAHIVVTSPDFSRSLVVSRAEGLALTWSHGPGDGAIAVTLAVPGVASVRCIGDVADDAIDIPAEALLRLPAGPVDFDVLSGLEADVEAGGFAIAVGASDLQVAIDTSLE